MITVEQAHELLASGGNVVDAEGTTIGGIGQVFFNDRSGEPEWVTARTGMFGSAESFVPLRDAEMTGTDLRVPCVAEEVEDAPRIAEL